MLWLAYQYQADLVMLVSTVHQDKNHQDQIFTIVNQDNIVLHNLELLQLFQQAIIKIWLINQHISSALKAIIVRREALLMLETYVLLVIIALQVQLIILHIHAQLVLISHIQVKKNV